VVRGPIRLPRRVGPGGRTTEYPPNEWSPEEVERRIVGEPVEWLYVFDPLGRQVARFRGTSDEVDLSDELKQRSQGLYGQPVLRDHLIVHNHPPMSDAAGMLSYPPSPSDLLMIVERDLRELIVVSHEDRYRIRRPGDYWPTDEDELARILEASQNDQRQTHDPRQGTRRSAIARWRAVLEKLSDDGWIGYEQTHQTPRL
jgi:hypothetical protein